MILRKSILGESVTYSILRSFSLRVKKQCEEYDNNELLAKIFTVSTEESEKLIKRNPKLKNRNKHQIFDVVNVCDKFNIEKNQLFKHPNLFSFKSITLQHHGDVLLESGFTNIKPPFLLKYVTLATRQTINQLKCQGLIPKSANVQENLLNCLHSWPTSPAMCKKYHDNISLHILRMEIMARYLELNIDLSREDFEKKIILYTRVKHRPLKYIDDLLDILQHKIALSNKTICSNFGILQSDPNNVKMMLENIPSLAGMSLKEFILRRPTVLNRKWENVAKIQSILNKYNVPFEVQRNYPDVFQLDHEIVTRRFEEIKTTPELFAFMHHPNLIKLMFYKTKADIRLELLKKDKKKCATMNVLSGNPNFSLAFAQSQGDTNKGRDAKNIIKTLLDNKYSYSEINKVFQETGCVNVVPVQNLKIVYDNLKDFFSSQEIFDNCHILLFPWVSINKYLEPLTRLKPPENHKDSDSFDMFAQLNSSHIDISKLSSSSILSLILYFIEKEYHFTGQAIWVSNRINKYMKSS